MFADIRLNLASQILPMFLRDTFSIEIIYPTIFIITFTFVIVNLFSCRFCPIKQAKTVRMSFLLLVAPCFAACQIFKGFLCCPCVAEFFTNRRDVGRKSSEEVADGAEQFRERHVAAALLGDHESLVRVGDLFLCAVLLVERGFRLIIEQEFHCGMQCFVIGSACLAVFCKVDDDLSP